MSAGGARPPAPVVRRASRGDLSGLVVLWAELARHHASRDPVFRLQTRAEKAISAVLRSQLGDPDSAIFVTGDESGGGELQGFCTVRIDRAPPVFEETVRAEILDLAVRPEARRCGRGRALVDAALAWARGRDIGRVEVRVVGSNPEGQSFWRALGFDPFVDVLHRRL